MIRCSIWPLSSWRTSERPEWRLGLLGGRRRCPGVAGRSPVQWSDPHGTDKGPGSLRECAESAAGYLQQQQRVRRRRRRRPTRSRPHRQRVVQRGPAFTGPRFLVQADRAAKQLPSQGRRILRRDGFRVASRLKSNTKSPSFLPRRIDLAHANHESVIRVRLFVDEPAYTSRQVRPPGCELTSSSLPFQPAVQRGSSIAP